MSSEFADKDDIPKEEDEDEDEDVKKKFDTIMNVTMHNCRNNTVNSPLRSSRSCVSCKSLRSVNEICELVDTMVKSKMDKQSQLTRGEKEKAKSRFAEIYSKVFRRNVLVDGEPCPDDGHGSTTSEFEPVDLKKKNSISEVLIPSLDDAILKTVSLRKNVPKVCRKHWKNYGSREIRYLNSFQIQNVPVSSKQHIEIMAAVKDTLDDDHGDVVTTVKAIGAMSKDVVEDRGKLENLLKVKDLDTQMKQSTTYRALYDKPLSTPMKCVTPQKRPRSAEPCAEVDKLLRRKKSPRFACV